MCTKNMTVLCKSQDRDMEWAHIYWQRRYRPRQQI